MENLKPEPVIILSSSDLNKIVQDYAKIREFNCSLGASKETSSLCSGIEKKHYLSDKETFDDHVKDGHCDYDQCHFILYYLCDQGVIPEGTYVIDHSW